MLFVCGDGGVFCVVFCACDNNTETHTHEYVKTVVPATCSKRGFTLYVCACGDKYKDDYVNTLSHTPGDRG